MPRFAAGVIRFQNEVFPKKKALFERLSLGQSPEALFITCSDARIETAMITQSDPGDLFICRNAGNIVPPHTTKHTGGMTASIEFAVAVLKVPHIVICGHSECGALHGAMNPDAIAHLAHIPEWLGYTKQAVDKVNEIGAGLSDGDRMAALMEQNVILQLDHLKSHPCVKARLKEGDLQLHGWVYDIKTGAVSAYDDKAKKFTPVEKRYAEEISRLSTS